MTDREVMQQALKCIERLNLRGWILADFEEEVYASIDALKTALAQPEKEWIYGTPLLDAMTQDYVPAQRLWVGLTDDDWVEIDNKKDTALDSFAQGAVWAADQLKERNTCLG